ncbi:MAG: hypothetical protein JNJ83_07435 [Verrucomicrobiaceae bacterium]|nr:hypothetical protein [Verrucomicrobiaceae bacterium]
MIKTLQKLLTCALLLSCGLTAQAHIGYGGRDFGTLDPSGTTTNTINGQTVSTRFGWADAADADWGDSHRGRFYRFTLTSPSYVTITFTGVTGGTAPGLLMPGFTVYQGLAHASPADYDFSVVSEAWLDSRVGYQEGCLVTIGDFKIGNDAGTSFADLSSFTFMGYAVDGTSANFGSTPGIVGDGNADNTVTGTFFLQPGDYSVFVGGAEYDTQPTPSSVYVDAVNQIGERSYPTADFGYRVNGTISVSATNPASAVAFSSATVTAPLDSANAIVTLTRPVGGPAFTVTLTNTDGTALAGSHYTAPTGVVSFAANQTSKTVAIPLTPQVGIRPTRTFSLGLGAITGGVIAGTQTTTEVTIEGNDSGGIISLAATTATVVQGATSVSFTVNRTASLVPSTVALTTTNGTAVAGTDFVAPSATVDFAANETSKTVSLTLIPRLGVQPTRSFTVGLGATTGNATVGSPSSLTVTINPDPNVNAQVIVGDTNPDGIGYQWYVEMDGNDSASFQGSTGGWSWEDEGIAPAGGEGWTHTSRWVALSLTQPTVLTLTLAPDATVPNGTGGFVDSDKMAPSFTVWKNWDNDDGDDHTYPNRGNVPWAEDIVYLDHLENTSNTAQTKSWVLPAGQYTIVLGSNAPSANDPEDQGFSATFSTSQTAALDLVPNTYPFPQPSTGGVGYQCTVVAQAGQTGTFKSIVGAWSWSDTNPGFNPDGSQGWTHTSNWAAIEVPVDSFVTVVMAADAAVPFSGNGNVGGFAATDHMRPSFTLYRGWDNDGSDDHTYNNRGRVRWAEDLSYMDHLDNSSQSSVSRTWFLPAGKYTMAMGSNAPSTTNPPNQGYSFTWSAKTATPGVNTGDPGTGGIGYAFSVVADANDTGTFKSHVGAWSWSDTNPGFPADGSEGWTHTSNWVALQLTEPTTISVTMARDATVPFAGTGNVGGFAAVDHMFPSFTLYRGWDNDGGDHHTYPNRANVPWAEDISYMDHFANTTALSITRSWTLPAGNYTLALGSNSPSATNPPRQGYSFTYTTSAPVFTAPLITKQPKGAVVKRAVGKVSVQDISVTAVGPDLVYRWFLNGAPIDGATTNRLTLTNPTTAASGEYTVEVRNAAGWVMSLPAVVTVIEPPVVNNFSLPAVNVGQPVALTLSATNNPKAFTLKATGASFRNAIFRPATGEWFAIPTTPGTVTVTATASNEAGKSAPVSATFQVVALDANSVGTFNGLIGRSPFANENLGGCIKITTTVVGGFTGTLKLGTKSYPLSGALNTTFTTLTGSQTITRPGMTPITVAFSIPPTNRIAQGTVTTASGILPFTARNIAADAASFAGLHTLAILLTELDAANPANPKGHGYGSFTVSPKGIASGFLMLADATKITFSAPVETNGSVSLFSLLYKNGGSALTQLYMDAGDENNLAASVVDWLKKPEPTTSKSLVYKAGFGPLSLNVIGRKYVAPTSGIPLDATAGNNNATVTHGTDAAPVSTDCTVTKTTVTFAAPNTSALAMKASAATGMFSGSLTLNGSPAKFNGVIVDEGSAQVGYGFFLAKKAGVIASYDLKAAKK